MRINLKEWCLTLLSIFTLLSLTPRPYEVNVILFS